jgi:hypothetical protein
MLQRPWLTPLIVGCWCITSSWLLVTKILPSLRPGSPPGYQALYASGSRLLPVGWSVLLNGTPLGWALTESERTEDGGVIVSSRLHFDRLPVGDVLPSWAGTFFDRMLDRREVAAAFDARGRLTIDALGQLRSFNSIVDVPGFSDGILLEGTCDDGTVTVSVRAGDLRYDVTRHFPTHMMVGDELSPQATLPGLYEGRRWTVPVYSPIRAGRSPLEILHAEVGGEDVLFWENGLVRVNVVSYRDDPSSTREPRCRMWVDKSGRVLKQEAAILGARLAFIRRSDEAAATMAADLEADQNAMALTLEAAARCHHDATIAEETTRDEGVGEPSRRAPDVIPDGWPVDQPEDRPDLGPDAVTHAVEHRS